MKGFCMSPALPSSASATACAARSGAWVIARQCHTRCVALRFTGNGDKQKATEEGVSSVTQETSTLPWVKMARRIVEESRRPDAAEARTLLNALHAANQSGNPDAGRKDAALALRPIAAELPAESQLTLALVLHDWEGAKNLVEKLPDLRPYLFHALCTETPSVRRWLLRKIDRPFCRDAVEELMLDFARADFVALAGWGAQEELRDLLISLLKQMLGSPVWGAFHKDQGAQLLRRLGEKVPEVRRSRRQLASAKGSLLQPVHVSSGSDPPELHSLLAHLRRRGLTVDGATIRPDVQVGTVTGRITYRNPAVQTWSRDERLSRLRPQPGHVYVALDYAQIEPVILLNILVLRLWLALTHMPGGDIYRWFSPEDRSLGKEMVNRIINGGSSAVVDPSPQALRFVRAIEMFRQEWTRECRELGYVPSLFGRAMPFPEEPNVPGKVVNRLVQGTAADIFNSAVAEIHRLQCEDSLPGEITLLLFDEVWIHARTDQAERVARVSADVLRRSAARVCLFRVPDVRVSFLGGESGEHSLRE